MAKTSPKLYVCYDPDTLDVISVREDNQTVFNINGKEVSSYLVCPVYDFNAEYPVVIKEDDVCKVVIKKYNEEV